MSEREDYSTLLNKWNTSAVTFCVRTESIKGYVVLYANNSGNRRAFVPMLGVRPEYQRQNLGRYLLNVCEEFSRWKSMEAISLEVHKTNINAIGFYRHLGFSEETELENSYIYGKKL
ncbi:MAG: GNAT family N-acetyltransferase [Synergistaceae bacterium]|nr:GNAT family N-acetyltransferase [Synergistaceae bacterium]